MGLVYGIDIINCDDSGIIYIIRRMLEKEVITNESSCIKNEWILG